MKIELAMKPRKKPYIPIEAESITPEIFLSKNPEDITIWSGNRERILTDLFDVSINGDAKTTDDIEIILSGDCSRIKRVGEYMTGGSIIVLGSIGMHCGNFMSGGIIEIKGDADSWLGREMRGGKIICHGNAGDYCGSGYRGEKKGMTGGIIEVSGDAGDFTAETMTGGEVIIHGNAGNAPGAEMHGGTLKIFGDCRMPCANMDGGNAYVFGKAHDILPTFEKKGELEDKETGKILTEFNGDLAKRKANGRLYAANYYNHE